MLFSKLPRVDDARAEAILGVLCRSIVALEGERVWQYIIGPFARSQS